MHTKSAFELVMDYYNQADYMNEQQRLLSRLAEFYRLRMTDETASDKPAEKTIYDQVVENLNKRIVPEPTRGQIRKALDTADAEPTGRVKSDEALKRITR